MTEINFDISIYGVIVDGKIKKPKEETLEKIADLLWEAGLGVKRWHYNTYMKIDVDEKE